MARPNRSAYVRVRVLSSRCQLSWRRRLPNLDDWTFSSRRRVPASELRLAPPAAGLGSPPPRAPKWISSASRPQAPGLYLLTPPMVDLLCLLSPKHDLELPFSPLQLARLQPRDAAAAQCINWRGQHE